jgi:hypothetical protein
MLAIYNPIMDQCNGLWRVAYLSDIEQLIFDYFGVY